MKPLSTQHLSTKAAPRSAVKVRALAFAAVAIFGCSNTPQAYFVEAALPLQSMDGNCIVAMAMNTVDLGGFLDLGTLDLTPRREPAFLAGLRVSGQNRTNSSAIQVSGGQVLDSANRDAAVFDSMKLTYTLGGKALKSDVLPVTLSFSSDISRLEFPINIIGPNGIADLAAAVAPGTGLDANQRVTVGIEFKGKMSKLGSAVSTGVFPFPLTLVRSAPCESPTAGTCGIPGADRLLCQ
jgi:hypothetical protein